MSPTDTRRGGKCIHPSHANAVRRLESSRRLAVERGWAERVGWDIADVAGVDDGVSVRLGAARKAYGNAVVVQWAETLGRAVMAAMGAGVTGAV